MFGVSAFSFKYLLEMYNISFDEAGNYLGALPFEFKRLKINRYTCYNT